MSKPIQAGAVTPTVAADVPPDALVVPMGPQVLDAIALAHRARLPILLEGPTGVGKSQIAAEFAQQAQIGFAVLDLSLLEPPDLVGLPVIRDGRTHYAAPSELPQGGAGILMLEELNRAEIPVMQPALQLLSARRLHGYELPPGWSCVAAINPEDGDYQVHHLDAALRSRFLQLTVRADPSTWLPWATANGVHPAIVATVAAHRDAFEQASPRSWTYASKALLAMRPEERARPDLVRVMLRGYLPTAWTLRVQEQLAGLPPLPTLDVAALFAPGGDRLLADAARAPLQSGRTDLLAMLANEIRRAIRGPQFAAAMKGGAMSMTALESLFAALPGDLRDQCLHEVAASQQAHVLLRELATSSESIAEGYVGSPLQKELQRWRERMQLHRVRLCVAAARRWLTDHGDDAARLRAAEPNLRALAADAAVIGRDLQFALDARSPNGATA